jgi:hypothetical protein
MKKTKTIRKPRRSRIFNKSEFYKAPVSVSSRSVTIKLPKAVAEYIGLNASEGAFWVMTNGVVQIGGAKPNLAIPMLTINEGSFVTR